MHIFVIVLLGQAEEIRIRVVSILLSPSVRVVQVCRLAVGHGWGICLGKCPITAVDTFVTRINLWSSVWVFQKIHKQC